MCGICGQLNLDRSAVDRDRLMQATRLLSHRGPDDEGYYCEGYTGLGMRRLSIIDLDCGHQPIFNEDKTLCLVYNGELYNYSELKDELVAKGHTFTTNSDTEVVVHLYEEYGEKCLEKMNGMFAFALWNSKRNELFIARDRLGIKPLYYTQESNRFLFASELKSVHALLNTKPVFDPRAVDAYLRVLCISAPLTIYKDIYKLLPGHFIRIVDRDIQIKRYWDVPEPASRFTLHASHEHELISDCLSLLTDSVKSRLVSDVPFGAFLSGGIDSSVIVALMSQHLSEPVKTFSIGFHEKTYNELDFARMIAREYNTDHYEYMVGPEEMMTLLDTVMESFDEPFADSSALPTYVVSRIASEKVKMVLSGDGGDELFGGYDRYRAYLMSKKYQWLFSPLKATLVQKNVNLLSENTSIHGFSKRLKRFVKGFSLSDKERYLLWMSHCDDAFRNRLYTDQFSTEFSRQDFSTPAELSDKDISVEDIMRYDIKTYLPDDLLTKVDRMSMAHSLEVRVPFLDHRLVAFSQQIPLKMKIHGVQQKYLLRKISEKLIPKQILRRKKHGFGVPIGSWFRNELHDMLQNVFHESVLVKNNIFSKKELLEIFQEHSSGKIDHGQRLYAVYVLEKWMRKNI